MQNHEEFEKMDMIGKTIAQSILVVIGFAIAYFAVEFLGFGDWLIKNSIWLIAFMLVVVAIFMTNLAKWIVAAMKHNVSSDKDLLFQQLKDLELDIDYIKNSVKVLKADKE